MGRLSIGGCKIGSRRLGSEATCVWTKIGVFVIMGGWTVLFRPPGFFAFTDSLGL
ncbi:hypothetical protein SK128_019557, partial [Halocaridina rubra]